MNVYRSLSDPIRPATISAAVRLVRRGDYDYGFADWARKEKKKYVGLQDKRYIPRERLEAFWTDFKLKQLVQDYSAVCVLPLEAIRKSYLQTLSALVLADRVDDMQLFTDKNLGDNRLPLQEFPSEWAKDSERHQKAYRAVSKVQWVFFPLVFDSDRFIHNADLHLDFILPMTVTEEFKAVTRNRPTIQKVKVHRSCNRLVRHPVTTCETICDRFVLKSYPASAEREYWNELNALTEANNCKRPPPNIVRCHGSFRQNGRFNLLLEYCNGGNLGAFFQSDTPPPQDLDQMRQFWYSLSRIFQALDFLHQMKSDGGARGIHGDLKPQNMLIRRESSSYPYDFTLKLTDFGLSHLKLPASGDIDNHFLDRGGNQLYSAPECFRGTSHLRTAKNLVTTQAEIFSIGCILSESLVWSVSGKTAWENYIQRRADEYERVGVIPDSGYEGCFHNGIRLIQTVPEVHQEICEKAPGHSSHLVRLISDFILTEMLQDNPEKRVSARTALLRFDEILKQTDPSQVPTPGTVDDMDAPSDYLTTETTLSSSNSQATPQHQIFTHSTAPSSRRPGLSSWISRSSQYLTAISLQRRSFQGLNTTTDKRGSVSTCVSSVPSLDWISVEEVLKYRETKKKFKKEGVPPPQSFQGLHCTIRKFQTQISPRDHIFFIDDSETMKQYSGQVLETFQALSYITKKGVDKNELELIFATRPEKVFKSEDTTPLIRELERCEYERDPGLMRMKWGEFLQDNISRRLPSNAPRRVWGIHSRPRRRLSIIVFTDGAWGDVDEQSGVGSHIEKLIDELKDDTDVMIQFVRFGDNINHIATLSHLDNLGKAKGCDIVDSKPWTADVRKLLMGSIVQANDEDDGD